MQNYANYLTFLPDELLFEIAKCCPSNMLFLRCVSKRFKDFIDLFVIRSNSLSIVERYKRNYSLSLMRNVEIVRIIHKNLKGEDFYYTRVKKFLDTYFNLQMFITKRSFKSNISMNISFGNGVELQTDAFKILNDIENIEKIYYDRYLPGVLQHINTYELMKELFTIYSIKIRIKTVIDCYTTFFNEESMPLYTALYNIFTGNVKLVKYTEYLIDKTSLLILKHDKIKEILFNNLKTISEDSYSFKVYDKIVENGVATHTEIIYKIFSDLCILRIETLYHYKILLTKYKINMSCVFNGKTLFQIIFDKIKEKIKESRVGYILYTYKYMLLYIATDVSFDKSICNQGQSLKESITLLKEYKNNLIKKIDSLYLKKQIENLENLINSIEN